MLFLPPKIARVCPTFSFFRLLPYSKVPSPLSHDYCRTAKAKGQVSPWGRTAATIGSYHMMLMAHSCLSWREASAACLYILMLTRQHDWAWDSQSGQVHNWVLRGLVPPVRGHCSSWPCHTSEASPQRLLRVWSCGWRAPTHLHHTGSWRYPRASLADGIDDNNTKMKNLMIIRMIIAQSEQLFAFW